jgi:hypothetical protein
MKSAMPTAVRVVFARLLISLSAEAETLNNKVIEVARHLKYNISLRLKNKACVKKTLHNKHGDSYEQI